MGSQMALENSAILVQTIQQLGDALKALDFLGFPLAAIHVHNALSAIEVEVPEKLFRFSLDQNRHVEFSDLDNMAEILFS